MTNRSITVVLVAMLFLCFTNNNTLKKGKIARMQYIQQYTVFAQKQMSAHGIPASIIMAQAILESSDGNSTLARQANNHFGMKCKANWEGSTFYKKDDDRDQTGELISSCFRSYESAEASFEDYAEYLHSKAWYAPLFELSTMDYKGWAYGLKKAGYATAADYPQILISIIEENKLYTLDTTGSESFEQTKTRQFLLTEENASNSNPTNWDEPIQMLVNYTNQGMENSAVLPGSPPPDHHLRIRVKNFKCNKPSIRD